MTALAATAAEGREASPIGLVVVLFLLVALIFLIRSMNSHLRRARARFEAQDAGSPAEPVAAEPAAEDGPRAQS